MSTDSTSTTASPAPKPGTVPAVVGVLGGGRMGAGIAHAFLISGSRVTVVERDPQAAQSAKERIERDLAKSLERGAIDGNLDVWAQNLTLSLDQADFAQCDLVIEAVPEDFDLKVSSLILFREQSNQNVFYVQGFEPTNACNMGPSKRELTIKQHVCQIEKILRITNIVFIKIITGDFCNLMTHKNIFL